MDDTRQSLAKKFKEFLRKIQGKPLEETYKDDLVSINEMLMDEPDEIVLTRAALQHKFKRKSLEESRGHEQDAQHVDWNHVIKGSRIPKWLEWQWLSNNAGKDVLTKELISKMLRADRQVSGKIVERHTGVGAFTQIPEEMRNPQVIFQVFDDRNQQIGRDLKAFLKEYVDQETGVVNWAACPCYRLVGAGGDVPITSFCHSKTNLVQAFPGHINISTE